MNLRNILIRFAKVKIFIFLFLSLNLYCAETSRVSFNQQWDLNVTSIISSPDVESWNLYDISTVLMLPMYFSFRHDIKLSNGNLASYSFEKLLKKAYSYNLYKKNIGTVTRAQFIYFSTQYLKLKATKNKLTTFDLSLLELLLFNLDLLANKERAFHWSGNDFNGVLPRIRWKISKVFKITPKFHAALIDEDMFVLTAIADSLFISKKIGSPNPFDFLEISSVCDTVFQKFGTYEEEMWYFQKRVWSDHPDYLYAGNTTLKEKKVKVDISMDTAHSHRLPLWLSSCGDISSLNYNKAYEGFKKSFENIINVINFKGSDVLAVPNYIDGWNGFYRVGRGGKNNEGYEPFRNSAILFMGYFFPLDGRYIDLLERFRKQHPLNETQVEFYVGPGTARVQSRNLTLENYFSGSFYLFHSILAVCFHKKLSECNALDLSI